MKYLCLVYLSKEKWSACPDSVCFEAAQGLQMSGHLLAAEPLHPVETATTLRIRNGQLSMTDGPFAETKEHLLGFYVVDCADFDSAVDVARKLRSANPTAVYELRPIMLYVPGAPLSP